LPYPKEYTQVDATPRSGDLAVVQIGYTYPETALGIAEQQVKRMPNARFILLPITDATRGHGTHTVASIWKDDLIQFLQSTEPKP